MCEVIHAVIEFFPLLYTELVCIHMLLFHFSASLDILIAKYCSYLLQILYSLYSKNFLLL